MSTSKADSHFILFRELKIAVDFPHHVQYNFICRITTVHTSVKLTSCHRSYFLSLIIEFLIIFLQPSFKLKTRQTSVNLIGCHVCDWAYPKKWIDGSCGNTTICQLNGYLSLFLKIIITGHCLVSYFVIVVRTTSDLKFRNIKKSHLTKK